MLKVLAHPSSSRACWSRRSSLSLYLLCPTSGFSFLLYAVLSVLLATSIPNAAAQVLFGGQVLTNGFSIIDSPSLNSVLQSGSVASIAVDISGDGKLTSAGGLSNAGIDSLNMFLTSPQINMTVVAGPQFLEQEAGSTVKHLAWVVPPCLSSGLYNLTLYESSHAEEQQYFSITPIPVEIQSNETTGSCTQEQGLNDVLPLPQPSNPPPSNMTLPSGDSHTTQTVTAVAGLPVTIVIGPSGAASLFSGNPSSFITVTRTATTTAESISVSVMTQTETLVSTTTASGSTFEFTTTNTVLSTMTVDTVTTSTGIPPGFLPVNAAAPRSALSSLPFLGVLCTSMVLLVRWNGL